MIETDKPLLTKEEIDDAFRQVVGAFRDYVGTIEVTDKCVSIQHNNVITDDGQRVPCKVSVHLLCSKYPFAYDGFEKTYRILGGCGGPSNDIADAIEHAIHLLDRYKFEHKTGYEQLTLF